jgi:hypothetical protein
MWGLCVSVCACVCVCVCVCLCVCVLHPLSHPLLYLCVSLFCFGLKEAETITICTIGTGLPLQYIFLVQFFSTMDEKNKRTEAEFMNIQVR